MSQEPQIKYIERIQISNFWGMYDLDWTLDKDVNILIGKNGSGKTTLFDSIYQFLAFRNQYRELKSDQLLKQVSMGIIGSPDQFKRLATLLYSFEGNINIYFNDHIEQGGIISKDTNSFRWLDENKLPLKNQNSPIQLIKTFDALLVDRDPFEKKTKPHIQTALDYKIEDLIPDYLEYQLKLFKQAKNTKTNIEDVSSHYDLFIDIINELFADSNKKLNTNADRIQFILNDKIDIKPTELSSGEKHVLIILLNVLLQNREPNILLLDEPEITLHLGWQQKFIRLIKQLNPNCQLIIATHSPSMFGRNASYPIYRMEDLRGVPKPMQID